MRGALAIGLSLALYGCGGSASKTTPDTSGQTQAQQSDIAIASSSAGVTPFIASVNLTGQSVAQVTSVNFSIAAMPNTVSAPVSVTWSQSALSSHGYLQSGQLSMPVFGLYANYQNQVTFQLDFQDGSVQQLQTQISTQPYVDASGIYLSPTIVQARAPGSTLGFNFFLLKSLIDSPVIVDTDGQVRWVVPFSSSESSYYSDGEFVIGNQGSPIVALLQFDGSQSVLGTDLPQPLLGSFTHNIDPGPTGLLSEFNGTDALGTATDDIVSEILPFSSEPPVQTFDMAEILSDYMTSQGDDAAAFVRPDADWFHVNASTYDPSDDTVIVSSRENFLIKVNYSTHTIVWILGDPTKYWYTFPSLRAKALTLNAGGDYPIGQHGTSITADGYLMVMNDGAASANQPAGTSPGFTRPFSEVSAYSINAATLTAQNVWNYDHGKTIYSAVCGSSYEAGGSYLVDFATADDLALAEIVGLDSNKNVAFDFQYASPSPCFAAWNAIPISMENLQIQ